MNSGTGTAIALSGTAQLSDFELEIELIVAPGETVAIIGPNGSGKSSLLRVLAGLLRLQFGRLVVDNITVDEPTTRKFVAPHLRTIGWVPQGCLLFPHMDVMENICFSPRIDLNRIDGLIEALELTELVNRKPAECSGGQTQRIAFARALATDPNILLLDEPSSALDIESRQLIHRVLAEDPSKTTLLVTHDPVESAILADRIVVLEDGHISQSGPPGEIRNRPRTRYAASLTGLNFIKAEARGLVASTPIGTRIVLADPAHGSVNLVVPPSAVSLHKTMPEGSPRNAWLTTVVELQPSFERVRVILNGPIDLVAEVTPPAVNALGLEAGSKTWAAVKATEITCHHV